MRHLRYLWVFVRTFIAGQRLEWNHAKIMANMDATTHYLKRLNKTNESKVKGKAP